MRNSFPLAALLLLGVACGPQNDEVKDEQVTVAPPTQALDSIIDTRKDALRTDENETNPALPMPQPVMQLLTDKYPGWQQPTLSQEALAHADTPEPFGPTIIRGDFDRNNEQDVALQLQQDKDVIVVAALQDAEGQFQLHELTRDILFNDRGQLKSLYYLYLLKPGERLVQENKAEIKTEQDAVALGYSGNVKAYVYRGGTFEAYQLPK